MTLLVTTGKVKASSVFRITVGKCMYLGIVVVVVGLSRGTVLSSVVTIDLWLPGVTPDPPVLGLMAFLSICGECLGGVLLGEPPRVREVVGGWVPAEEEMIHAHAGKT